MFKTPKSVIVAADKAMPVYKTEQSSVPLAFFSDVLLSQSKNTHTQQKKAANGARRVAPTSSRLISPKNLRGLSGGRAKQKISGKTKKKGRIRAASALHDPANSGLLTYIGDASETAV